PVKQTPLPAGVTSESPRVSPPPVQPAKPAAKPATKPATQPKTAAVSSKNLIFAGAGFVAVIAAVIGVIKIVGSHPQPKPKPVVAATFKVTLRSSPEGAVITVDGKPCGTSTCEMPLSPGSHRADATLNGYQNATKEFAVAADKGGPA